MIKNQFSKRELYKYGPQPTYNGRNLDEIAFPLGGIGTGSISIGGWGQLRDWEIMNRPAKGFVILSTFFTLKAKFSNGNIITKVLQGPVEDSYTGEGQWVSSRLKDNAPSSYVNISFPRNLGQGLPHFQKVEFRGHFPIATLSFSDPDLPLTIQLEAFNPFIPLNDKDSSIPVAIFYYTVKNTSKEKISLKIFGNLTNILGYPESAGDINEIKEGSNIKGLFLSTTKVDKTATNHGSMVLATTWPDSTIWPRWKELRSHDLRDFWEKIALSDDFPPEQGESITGTVCANFTLEPGIEVTIPFIISWFFPNFEHYWGQRPPSQTIVKLPQEPGKWKTYYSTVWKDAWDVALYVSANLDRLWGETKLFNDTLFSSTLPIHVLDAISSQISTLKTNTCLRLEDGTFYGFEGCANTGGCCEGSCTHVWNYAQALPYLFPNLQRSMLNAHLKNSVEEDGFMTFRMPLPKGIRAKPNFFPAADGQMGTVMQAYREWLICGNDEWLKSIWPTIKKVLEFTWKYWDPDKDGVMEGVQHTTYDGEFYGPNTMTGSLYLGALRAAEEIACYLGEEEKAREYHKIFENGSKKYDNETFNGDFYEQIVNPLAFEIWPDFYRKIALRGGKDSKFKDWPKRQFGKGCLSDQMIGQWYSHILGLGYLFDAKRVHKTLESIFKYNWKKDLSEFPCTDRVYALNDESGLLLCTWPKGSRPGDPFLFADEVWCGTEYQVASNMIYEGLIDEGLKIIMGVRLRHRGDRRNPWNEFECGWHYSRSMSSYSLLLTLSGYLYSSPKKKLSFSPKISLKNFNCFFSTADGWGTYNQKIKKNKADYIIELKYGSLVLNELELPLIGIKKPRIKVIHNGEKIDFKTEIKSLILTIFFNSLVIKKNQMLKISIQE